MKKITIGKYKTSLLLVESQLIKDVDRASIVTGQKAWTPVNHQKAHELIIGN